MREPHISVAASAELTELQQLRIALAEKQAQLTAALGAARMATWHRDPQTGCTTTSDSMDQLWGLLPEQTFVTHAQDYQLLHPEDREPHQARVRSAIETGSSWHAQFRTIRPFDGRTAWLEERGSAQLDRVSGRATVDGLICDITERKLAEAVLRESNARKTFLLHLDDALRPLADPIRIQFEAARVLGRYLGADQTYYTGPHGDLTTVVALPCRWRRTAVLGYRHGRLTFPFRRGAGCLSGVRASRLRFRTHYEGGGTRLDPERRVYRGA